MTSDHLLSCRWPWLILRSLQHPLYFFLQWFLTSSFNLPPVCHGFFCLVLPLSLRSLSIPISAPFCCPRLCLYCSQERNCGDAKRTNSGWRAHNATHRGYTVELCTRNLLLTPIILTIKKKEKKLCTLEDLCWQDWLHRCAHCVVPQCPVLRKGQHLGEFSPLERL